MVDPARLRANVLGRDEKSLVGVVGPAEQIDPVVLSVPAVLKRAGVEMKMVLTDGSEPGAVNAGLVRLIARARNVRNSLHQDTRLTIADLAAEEGVGASYLTRLLRLGYLAPSVVTAILEGRQPLGLSVRKLMDDTRLPLDWDKQARTLGFA